MSLQIPSPKQVRQALPGVRDALPGLVRVATSSTWRALQWATTTWITTARNITTAVMNGEAPAQIVADTRGQFRAMVQSALGMNTVSANGQHENHSRPGSTTEELQARGRQLLHDSADVWFTEDTHPAYAAILEELTPDEARILRFLAAAGPQPSVDVRTSRPLGRGSEMVAAGLSMIGLHAGVRNVAWTNAHLGNLHRLGLVDFPHEQVADPTIYQVLEVQPDVQDAMQKAGRSSKTIHRSIELTIFGQDFCRVCLPLDG
jgi:hypothetical protein